MMKPTCSVPAILAAFFLSLLITGPLLGQEDVTVVEDSAFTSPRRALVPFRHEDHNEKAAIEDCNVCHHMYRDGVFVEDESSEDSQCSDCHGIVSGGGSISLARTYHNRCKGCHEDQGRGPVMCGECHVRDQSGE